MEGKKGRSQFDQTEKSVFWNILKSQQGGKIWKTIIESKNNTARRDAWKVVADVFANHINSEFTPQQARDLFRRMKMAKKKEHDRKAIDRDYKKACSGTGGGPSPDAPTQDDGDDLDDELLDMDDFEPARTEYNVLVHPQDKEFFHLGATSTPRTSLGAKSNRKILRDINLNRPFPSSPVVISHKSPLNSDVQSITNSDLPSGKGFEESKGHELNKDEDEEESSLRDENIFICDMAGNMKKVRVEKEGFKESTGHELNKNEDEGESSFRDENVFISDMAGNMKKVRVEKPKEKVTQQKEKKKAPKKSMNDEASNYYSSMLKLQTKLTKRKMKFYKRKENVEILKQKLLEAAAVKEGLSIPAMSLEDSLDSTETDGTDSD